jgi:hypothetical protein
MGVMTARAFAAEAVAGSLSRHPRAVATAAPEHQGDSP